MSATGCPRRRRWASALAVVSAVLVPTPVSAEAPTLQGWWTATNPGGLPAAVPAPDVPEDGLLVESGPQAPSAYAALSYPLSGGASATRLALEVAEGGVTGPGSGLVLCLLEDPVFPPAQGGALAEAPAYDCESTAVGTLDGSGTTFVFEVAPLVRDGVLAVAVLPTAASRVVLSRPDEQSLTTKAPAAGTDSTSSRADDGASAPAGPATSGARVQDEAAPRGFVLPPALDDGAVSLPLPTDVPVQVEPPVLAGTAPVPPDELEAPAGAVVAAGQEPAVTGADGVLRLIALALVAAGACSTALWAFVGGSSPGRGTGLPAAG